MAGVYPRGYRLGHRRQHGPGRARGARVPVQATFDRRGEEAGRALDARCRVDRRRPGLQGADSELRLSGWSRKHRVVVLGRPLTKELAVVDEADPQQLRLSFTEVSDEVTVYEYAVPVTSLDDEILTLAQHYRDRANCENNFDELKNHWGWGGLTTQDLKRCRFMARMTALVYNWCSLFVRLADPNKHTESLTSRPLLLRAPARLTRHSGQTRVSISHSRAEATWARIPAGASPARRLQKPQRNYGGADSAWAIMSRVGLSCSDTSSDGLGRIGICFPIVVAHRIRVADP
jgi:hypothetical protein